MTQPETTRPRTVLIGGASGFIGTELVQQLRADGHVVRRLVRRPASGADEVSWDPAAGILPVEALEGVDAVVNLSGASLSRLPWTYRYKRQILQSRVQSTETLARAIAAAPTPPSVFVSGSAVGFYGDRPGELLTEQAAQGEGFLPRVVASWEGATAAAEGVTRVAHARTGLVIGEGGALTPLRLLTNLGAGGPLGTGRQWWPWISLHDEAAAIRHLIFESELSGAVNLVGPTPATAETIGRTLANELKRPYWLPAPRWALIAALADAGRELLLSDQRVVAQRLLDDGFTFRDATAEGAVTASVRQPSE